MQLITIKHADREVEFRLERVNSDEAIEALELPGGDNYNTIYKVTQHGTLRFYVGRSYIMPVAAGEKTSAAKETVVWYANKKMWHSAGNTIAAALVGAMRDAYLSI